MAVKNVKRDPLKTKNGRPKLKALPVKTLLEMFEKSSGKQKDKVRRMLLNIRKNLKKTGQENLITIG